MSQLIFRPTLKLKRVGWTYFGVFGLIIILRGTEASAAAIGPLSQSLSKADRIQTIQDMLVAGRSLKADQKEKGVAFASKLNGSLCQGDQIAIQLACWRSGIESYCQNEDSSQRNNCQKFLEMVVVNGLNQKVWVSAQERYQVLKGQRKGGDAVKDLMDQKFGVLALDFAQGSSKICGGSLMFQPATLACLSSEIEMFCHNPGRRNLSWQGCATALSWFIGQHGYLDVSQKK